MKKFLVIPLILFAIILFENKECAAQVLDGVYVKEHIPARKPVPYKFLREADVMFRKRIWRIIDLREKINHPLYYPKTKIGDRISLIDLMLWGVNTEGITPYSSDDDRFLQPISRSQIEVAFGAVEKPITYTNQDGEEVTETVKGDITSSEVKQYILKEDWFFDRQHSIMDVRIIGICPIRFYVKEEDQLAGGDAEVRISPLFWIYFPEVRRVLANHEVFNESNDAERRTFDDIFFKRKFNSYILAETNVHDNRKVSDYSLGVQSMLESEKIKQKMSDYEQDLWNY